MGSFSLAELPPYGVCRVERVEDRDIKARLEGIGITEGAEIVNLFSAPSGDPIAYSVRGAAVALRRSDARAVIVRGCGEWA